MKRIPLPTLLFLSIFLLLQGTLLAQQKPGLLWRISGNGLSKPSWLYGTIHLTDKRVFNFGDSLYAALEKSEGYAMELHPDSISIEALKGMGSDTALLKNALSIKEFSRIKKKLQAVFDKSPGEITVKEFKRKATEVATRVDKNSMHTIMDAYFYNAARRMGKWTGGIEDVADQLPLQENTPLGEYVQDFMHDNQDIRRELGGMIDIYVNEDLDAISAKKEFGTEMIKDSIMLRRNRKMSRRMDSLGHLRSTFFAVGAAHLPGDSGVVNLLKLRGFTVEPVLSSKRVHANDYHFRVQEVPWVTVASNTDLYTVQLPGKPQDPGVDAGDADVKFYIDISSNIVYLVSGGPKAIANDDSLIAQAVKRMSSKARITESHEIVYDSVKGKDVIAIGPDANYRIRLLSTKQTVYLLLISSPMDTALRSADAERFFKSLVINKTVKPNAIGWSTYKYPGQGIAIDFPGKPLIKSEHNLKAGMINTSYSSPDIKAGGYFQCLVQDLSKGFYLSGDTIAFNNYLRFVKSDKKYQLLSERNDIIQNYPALWIEFTAKEGNETVYNKVLSVHRGNRIYYLFCTMSDPVKNKGQMDRFFHSFSLIPVKETNWSSQTAPDSSFTTWAPLPVTQSIDTAEDGSKSTSYTLYDSTAPATYNVNKAPYSRYYWAKSDTSLLRATANGRISYHDSLLSYTPVTNGNYKGVDLLIRMSGNHNLKKIRLLLVGDSLYVLAGINAKEFFELDNNRRLFDDFRVNHNTASTLFTNKTRELLAALQSPDSLTFSEAKTALNKVPFGREDLPLLHKAMLQRYRDSAEYNTANNSLFNIIGDLKDETTIETVKQCWETLPADKEDMRYELLRMVAVHQTAASFSLVRDLLLQHRPGSGTSYRLFRELSDSLELVKPLLPDLLPLLKDSIAEEDIVSMVHTMLDSSLVDIALINKYKKELYGMASAGLKRLQKKDSDDYWYEYNDLIKVLVKLKDPVAFQWVRKMLVQQDIDVKHAAAIALLKSGQPVDAAEWLKLAADKSIRTTLYEELEGLKKTALFPKQYFTEKAFAESDLYSYASEDDEVKKMTFVGERIVMYKGARKRFYLFSVDLSYEDEKIIHLGVAGPFGLKPAKPVINAAATGIKWDSNYKASTIDADLKAYLEERAKYDE